MEVVLLDTAIEGAEKGKSYSTKLLDKAISRGVQQRTKNKHCGALSRYTSYDDLEGCDLIIEAVFEDIDIKAECTRQSEAVIPETAFYASNTSTLPITELAKASKRPNSLSVCISSHRLIRCHSLRLSLVKKSRRCHASNRF